MLLLKKHQMIQAACTKMSATLGAAQKVARATAERNLLLVLSSDQVKQ